MRLKALALALAPVCLAAALLAGSANLAPPDAAVAGFVVRLGAPAAAGPDAWRQQMQGIVQATGERDALVGDVGLQLGAALGSGWFHVHTARPVGVAEAQRLAALLRADPHVAAVAPDQFEQRMDVTPSDGRYGAQWWLQAPAAGNEGVANFTAAWSRSTGVANGAAVAVLDSGITSHPELNSRLLPGYDFVSDPLYAADGDGADGDPADAGDAISDADRVALPAKFSGCPPAPLSSWHGTVIAGQLAAVTNTVDAAATPGVAAINWNGRVLPVRVAGKCGATVADIVNGLRWAAGLLVDGAPLNPNPVRLVVLSYGGVDPCDAGSATPEVAATARLYLDTLAELRTQGANGAGTLVFAAAGNQSQLLGRPASCAGAVAVTALNREGFKARYANFGPQVAFATPGGDAAAGGTGQKCDEQLADSGIISTANLGDTTPGAAGYAAASGTSFAAPVAAGLASLMLAVDPTLTPTQIVDLMKASVRPHVRTPQLGNCSLTDNPTNPFRCGCTAATCGAGLLDADRALALVQARAENRRIELPALTPTVLSNDRLAACASVLGLPPLADPTPAPPEPTPTPTPTPAAGGGGGGALAPLWLLWLALAVVLAAVLAARPHAKEAT